MKVRLKRIAKDYDLILEAGLHASEQFSQLIENLQEKYNAGVVVLIDEYDCPILDHITDLEIAGGNRDWLRSFYRVLKGMDEFIRFIFVTGITKFTKTSVFSGLNNLRDITLMPEYAGICGFTASEFEELFAEHIAAIESNSAFMSEFTAELLSERPGEKPDLRAEIYRWYDGYSWDGVLHVFNPFSLLCFFDNKELSSYWYSSGTPTFLLQIIKDRPGELSLFTDTSISKEELDVFDLEGLALKPLLMQTGYLTVAETLRRGREYRLEFPNLEVREAFNRNILSTLTGAGEDKTSSAWRRLRTALMQGKPEQLKEELEILFATIPYELHIAREAYFHSLFFATMHFLGFAIEAEVSVAGGRVDGILTLGGNVYILEMKYREEPKKEATKKALLSRMLKQALTQIEERGYAKRFEGTGLQVFKVALAVTGRSDVAIRVVL